MVDGVTRQDRHEDDEDGCCDHDSYTGYDHRRSAVLSEDGHSSCDDECVTGPRTRYVNSVTSSLILHQLNVNEDGTERQIIKDTDGNMPRPKIRACSINDPFVLIFREDDSIGLFIGETERGKIRRKDMSPMGDKVRCMVILF